MARGLERTVASSYTIEELLVLVEKKNVRIPHFQRGLRWGPSDVVKLFDSIYKGYPIGTLLLWERPGPEHTLWVVDGQQRITSLATVLLRVDGNPPASRALYFDLATEQFVWQRQSGPRDIHLPLREAYKLPNVMAWLRERDLDDAMQERAFDLADRLRNYRIPGYTVETEREGDVAALREIFDRINTFGKRMNRAEVFHALTSLSTPGGRDLSHIANEIASRGFGAVADSTLVLCVLSIRGPDVLRDFRAELADDSLLLSETTNHAERAVNRTITFLREEAGVPHFDLVPYQHLLVVLVRFFALHEKSSEWERVLLRRWYWRAAVHGPLPKLGSTGTLRLALNLINERSAYDTVAALLDAFPSERRWASVDRLQLNRADSRIALCAMARLGPLRPAATLGDVAVEIDVAQVLTTERRDALPRLFPVEHGDLARSAANRVFWSDASAEDPAISLASAEPGVLASHAISETAAEVLRNGHAEAFLGERHAKIQQVVDDFVDARAEWDYPTRPALASL